VWVEGAWPADDRAVADFVVSEAGRLPEPAEKIEIGGLEVEIESVENDRIMSVIVRPREEDDDEDEGTA
jgi:CBS domain containing-hemolysin-like protein